MSAETIALTRQLIEYGKQKGVPRFVRDAAELLAVCDTGCDNLGDEIERLRAIIKGVEIALARDEDITAAMKTITSASPPSAKGTT